MIRSARVAITPQSRPNRLSQRHCRQLCPTSGSGDVDMGGSSQRLKLMAGAVGTAASMLLGGCAHGIELKGKVFDLLGGSPAGPEASPREAKLAERAPLVMPPDAKRLPDPGSAPATATDQANWPTDPEQRKLAAAQERERLHLAYCRGDIQWKERAFNSKDGSGTNLSPYGPCPSIFGGLSGRVNKN